MRYPAKLVSETEAFGPNMDLAVQLNDELPVIIPDAPVVAPACVIPTFDRITIFNEGSETNFAIGQLRYGTDEVAGGLYPDESSFTAEHPGLTLQDFTGIAADGGTAAVPGFPGFVLTTLAPDALIFGRHGTTYPFCFLYAGAASTLVIQFNAPVRAASFRYAATKGTLHVIFDSTTTPVHQFWNYVGSAGYTTFPGFAGFAT